jgi:hypothetical protein
MPKYTKFYVSLVGGAAMAVASIWAGTLAGQIAIVVLAALTATGVRQLRNGPAPSAVPLVDGAVDPDALADWMTETRPRPPQ